MSKFRKKPVVIDAIQWAGGDYKCLNEFCVASITQSGAYGAAAWLGGAP